MILFLSIPFLPCSFHEAFGDHWLLLRMENLILALPLPQVIIIKIQLIKVGSLGQRRVLGSDVGCTAILNLHVEFELQNSLDT